MGHLVASGDHHPVHHSSHPTSKGLPGRMKTSVSFRSNISNSHQACPWVEELHRVFQQLACPVCGAGKAKGNSDLGPWCGSATKQCIKGSFFQNRFSVFTIPEQVQPRIPGDASLKGPTLPRPEGTQPMLVLHISLCHQLSQGSCSLWRAQRPKPWSSSPWRGRKGPASAPGS